MSAALTLMVAAPVSAAASSADLQRLEVQGDNIVPAFSPDVTKYTLVVPFPIGSINVIAVPANSGCIVIGAGYQMLRVGSNTINIGVSAQGAVKTYIITITRLSLTDIVTFNIYGDSAVKQAVNRGEKALPYTPTREGYIFEGWYRESACLNRWDFNTPINYSITLYAKWRADLSTAIAVRPVRPLTAYPNPVMNGRFVIENAAGGRVEVYTPAGTLAAAYDMSAGSIVIDIGHLSAGIYIVRSGSRAVKVVKK